MFDGGDADQSLRAHLEDIIDEHEEEGQGTPTPAGDLSPIERLMLRNVLHFSENDAADVCIPRSDIVALPHSADWADVVAAFAEHGHSRMPVYRDTLDEIIGMMLIKDVFAYLARAEEPQGNWTRLMRQPLFVPTSRGALDVLADMRQSRVHLAVVVDEYSGTEGIITFEDLVEEIVGEIEDEHDDAPTQLLRPLPDGMWDADAKALLEDVGEKIDPRLAQVEEDIDTLGGLAFVMSGHVPDVGAHIAHPSGWIIEVTEADERHVMRLRLHPPVNAPGDEKD
jgi:magnesium and cobalt transporter